MKSNLPTLLGQQDFMSSNWDMVKSARLEPLTDEQIEYNSNRPMLYGWDLGNRDRTVIGAVRSGKSIQLQWMNVFELAKNAKVGDKLRVRLPADWHLPKVYTK